MFNLFRKPQTQRAPVARTATLAPVKARAEGEPNSWDILLGISGVPSLSGPELSPLVELSTCTDRT